MARCDECGLTEMHLAGCSVFAAMLDALPAGVSVADGSTVPMNDAIRRRFGIMDSPPG